MRKEKALYKESHIYLTKSLVELSSVGKNTVVTIINTRLEAFPAWNAASIDKRHALLRALAQDVWKTTPIAT